MIWSYTVRIPWSIFRTTPHSCKKKQWHSFSFDVWVQSTCASFHVPLIAEINVLIIGAWCCYINRSASDCLWILRYLINTSTAAMHCCRIGTYCFGTRIITKLFTTNWFNWCFVLITDSAHSLIWSEPSLFHFSFVFSIHVVAYYVLRKSLFKAVDTAKHQTVLYNYIYLFENPKSDQKQVSGIINLW